VRKKAVLSQAYNLKKSNRYGSIVRMIEQHNTHVNIARYYEFSTNSKITKHTIYLRNKTYRVYE